MFRWFNNWLTLLVQKAVETIVLGHFDIIHDWQASTTERLRFLEGKLQQSKKLPAFVVARGVVPPAHIEGPVVPTDMASGVRFLSPGETHRFTIIPYQQVGDVKVSVEAPFVIVDVTVGNMIYMRSDSPEGEPASREISVGFVNVANKITVDVRYPALPESSTPNGGVVNIDTMSSWDYRR